jgi:hypothetical protein
LVLTFDCAFAKIHKVNVINTINDIFCLMMILTFQTNLKY